MIPKEIKEKIIQRCISLEKYGVDDLAWRKEDALALINDIKDDKIGILGGDVYKLASNHLEPLYDNWSCEPNENETEEEYFFRSKVTSLKYIKSYLVNPDEKIVFSITFTEKIR